MRARLRPLHNTRTAFLSFEIESFTFEGRHGEKATLFHKVTSFATNFAHETTSSTACFGNLGRCLGPRIYCIVPNTFQRMASLPQYFMFEATIFETKICEEQATTHKTIWMNSCVPVSQHTISTSDRARRTAAVCQLWAILQQAPAASNAGSARKTRCLAT
jgi:hypothetical protein